MGIEIEETRDIILYIYTKKLFIYWKFKNFLFISLSIYMSISPIYFSSTCFKLRKYWISMHTYLIRLTWCDFNPKKIVLQTTFPQSALSRNAFSRGKNQKTENQHSFGPIEVLKKFLFSFSSFRLWTYIGHLPKTPIGFLVWKMDELVFWGGGTPRQMSLIVGI